MKSCVVTGAGRGIGRAIAEALAGPGIVVHAATRAECDVADERSVERFFRGVHRTGVLVLNAGVLERAPLQDFTPAQFDRVLGTNLRGAYLCARAVWPQMLQTGGRIIAIGSISGTLGTAEAAAYNASKWGLTGFVKSLAEEGRAAGIFCATVLPSGVDTDMIRKTPFEPQMKPADVAGVVRFLAFEAPFAMTGGAVEVFG